MLRMKKIVFVLLTLTALPVLAHDLWLERVGDGYVLLQGHRHASHEGAETLAYRPDIVRRAACMDAQGQVQHLGPTATFPFRIAGPCAVVWVQTSSGYWTKTVHGTRNQPQTGLSGVVKSWLSEESVKRIEQWSPAVAKPLGAALELTIENDPSALHPGDKLRLRVTLGGTPRAGVTVAYDGEPRGVSGDDGRINLRIRHPGLQLISASIEEPLQDDRADTVIRTTTLNLEIAPR